MAAAVVGSQLKSYAVEGKIVVGGGGGGGGDRERWLPSGHGGTFRFIAAYRTPYVSTYSAKRQ